PPRSPRRERSLVVALVTLAALAAAGCDSTGGVAGRGAADVTSAQRRSDVVGAWGKKRVDGEWVAGLVIGLVKNGAVETYGFGRVADDTSRVPDGDTAFEIASVTKVFTAALLADAVSRREVRLDQPVNELLPGGARLGGRASS